MNNGTFDFQKEVIDASREQPVLVDFWAPWCGPCQMLMPVLTAMEQKAQGRWKLVKINVDDEPALAQMFQLRGVPAVKLVVDGRLAGEFYGFQPEAQVTRWLDQQLAAVQP